MAKAGRNDPCRCGSGKKYKRCCADKDAAASSATLQTKAEAGARDLLARYPDVHDGYDRLGMVAEARGDKNLAASCYRKVAEFARLHSDRYDPGLAKNYQLWADELDPRGED